MQQSRLASSGVIPPWTRADRLAKALDYSGVTKADMAAALGVETRTVNNYLNGTTKRVPKPTILVWAELTGVDAEWLENGTPPTGEIAGTGPM